MTAFTLVSDAIPESERNARVYDGEIIVFRQIPAVRELVAALAEHVTGHYGEDPTRVHTRLNTDAVHDEAQNLRKLVAKDPGATQNIRAALEAVGVDAETTYDDGLEPRVQPPKTAAEGDVLSPLGAHRDTWASNLMTQVNWWAPVWPITVQRTLAIFPAHFRRAVPNSSADWDFAELLRRIKAGESTDDYPLLPLATEPPAWEDAVPVTIEPGDLMAFSGAQLHASVPNTTDRTRFSFEIRTVSEPDTAAGRGAPNVDGRAPRTTYQWFRRLSDRVKLGRMA